MREMTTKNEEVLVCQVCQREDGAKSQWGGEIEVWRWWNPCDHGTKTRRNPEFTGEHIHASCTRVHTTFPIETKQEDMVKLFEAEKFNNQWTNGDVWEVVGVDRAFVDHDYFGK